MGVKYRLNLLAEPGTCAVVGCGLPLEPPINLVTFDQQVILDGKVFANYTVCVCVEHYEQITRGRHRLTD